MGMRRVLSIEKSEQDLLERREMIMLRWVMGVKMNRKRSGQKK